MELIELNFVAAGFLVRHYAPSVRFPIPET